MKDNEKKMILILVIVAVVIIGLLLIVRNAKNKQEDTTVEKNVEITRDGVKQNNSSKLKETKTVNGIEISDVQLVNRVEGENSTYFVANVKNTTSVDMKSFKFDITLLDEKGNTIKVFEDMLIQNLKAGDSKQFSVGIESDYANAYDYTVKAK